MSFLNATLIFGVVAASIPVLLHLIARKEPRKVVFPSVRFLTKRFESNRSRLRVRRWWLLAMRIAALVLLALALARPAIHQSLSLTWLTIGIVTAMGVTLLVMASVAAVKGQSRPLILTLCGAALLAILISAGWGVATYATGPGVSNSSQQPVAMAILLDNSATSAWKTSSDDRIERMKEVAAWMIARVPRSSRIAIIDRSSQVAAFALDTSSALARVEQTQPLHQTQNITARLEAAIRLVRTSDLPNRQVLVITDLSEGTWKLPEGESSLSSSLSSDPEVSLTLFDLGDFEAANRTLSSPRFSDATPPRGAAVPLSTTIELNDAAATGENVSLSATAELELFQSDPGLPVVRDGEIVLPAVRSVDRTSVQLSPGATAELLLTIPALDTGIHHGRVRLVGPDAMPLDDVRYFSLEVLPPSAVLMVGDNDDETRIMSQAITAAAGLIDQEQSEYQIERIRYDDFAVVRLEDFAAVILLDPPADVLQEPSLLAFGRAGGGIFTTLGPAAINQQTTDESVTAAWAPTLERPWRVPAPGTFMRVAVASHPVTQSLAEETPWADFRVQQYWLLEPQENDRVLFRFAGTDHPAVVERRFDPATESGTAGRAVVVATPMPALAPPTRNWNDLFGTDPWPAWLMLRQSIEYLTRRTGDNLTVQVGNPATLKIATRDSGVLNPDGLNSDVTNSGVTNSSVRDSRVPVSGIPGTPRRLQLFAPGRSTPRPLDVEEEADEMLVTAVDRAGTYWVRGAATGLGFSANLSPEATRLDRIDPASLDLIFGPNQFSLAMDREGIEFAENRSSQRISLVSPALLLVLIVFLLEQVLSNRFYQSQRRAA